MDSSSDSEATRLLSSLNYRNRAAAKRDVLTALQHYRGLRMESGESWSHYINFPCFF